MKTPEPKKLLFPDEKTPLKSNTKKCSDNQIEMVVNDEKVLSSSKRKLEMEQKFNENPHSNGSFVGFDNYEISATKIKKLSEAKLLLTPQRKFLADLTPSKKVQFNFEESTPSKNKGLQTQTPKSILKTPLKTPCKTPLKFMSPDLFCSEVKRDNSPFKTPVKNSALTPVRISKALSALKTNSNNKKQNSVICDALEITPKKNHSNFITKSQSPNNKMKYFNKTPLKNHDNPFKQMVNEDISSNKEILSDDFIKNIEEMNSILFDKDSAILSPELQISPNMNKNDLQKMLDEIDDNSLMDYFPSSIFDENKKHSTDQEAQNCIQEDTKSLSSYSSMEIPLDPCIKKYLEKKNGDENALKKKVLLNQDGSLKKIPSNSEESVDSGMYGTDELSMKESCKSKCEEQHPSNMNKAEKDFKDNKRNILSSGFEIDEKYDQNLEQNEEISEDLSSKTTRIIRSKRRCFGRNDRKVRSKNTIKDEHIETNSDEDSNSSQDVDITGVSSDEFNDSSISEEHEVETDIKNACKNSNITKNKVDFSPNSSKVSKPIKLKRNWSKFKNENNKRLSPDSSLRNNLGSDTTSVDNPTNSKNVNSIALENSSINNEETNIDSQIKSNILDNSPLPIETLSSSTPISNHEKISLSGRKLNLKKIKCIQPNNLNPSDAIESCSNNSTPLDSNKHILSHDGSNFNISVDENNGDLSMESETDEVLEKHEATDDDSSTSLSSSNSYQSEMDSFMHVSVDSNDEITIKTKSLNDTDNLLLDHSENFVDSFSEIRNCKDETKKQIKTMKSKRKNNFKSNKTSFDTSANSNEDDGNVINHLNDENYYNEGNKVLNKKRLRKRKLSDDFAKPTRAKRSKIENTPPENKTSKVKNKSKLNNTEESDITVENVLSCRTRRSLTFDDLKISDENVRKRKLDESTDERSVRKKMKIVYKEDSDSTFDQYLIECETNQEFEISHPLRNLSNIKNAEAVGRRNTRNKRNSKRISYLEINSSLENDTSDTEKERSIRGKKIKPKLKRSLNRSKSVTHSGYFEEISKTPLKEMPEISDITPSKTTEFSQPTLLLKENVKNQDNCNVSKKKKSKKKRMKLKFTKSGNDEYQVTTRNESIESSECGNGSLNSTIRSNPSTSGSLNKSKEKSLTAPLRFTRHMSKDLSMTVDDYQKMILLSPDKETLILNAINTPERKKQEIKDNFDTPTRDSKRKVSQRSSTEDADHHWIVRNAPDSPTVKTFIRTPKRNKNIIKNPIVQLSPLVDKNKFGEPSIQSLYHLSVSPIVSKLRNSNNKKNKEFKSSTPAETENSEKRQRKNKRLSRHNQRTDYTGFFS